MYSVVLITTLTVGTTAPGFGFSSGYSGYAGYGWGGCGCGCGCGAWTFGGYGFAGGGYGYHGGCYGAYGTWYGGYSDFGCSGCYGCHGGFSGYGIPVPVQEPPVGTKEKDGDAFPPINPPKDKKIEDVAPPKVKKDDKDAKFEVTEPMHAKVRIDVPQGGTLYVDGQRIAAAPGQSTFRTPALAPGQKYFYDIRIVVERNGQAVSDQRRIIIQAGQDVAVAFPHLSRKGTVVVQANE